MRALSAEGFEPNEANKETRAPNEDLTECRDLLKPCEAYPMYIEIMSWWVKGEKEKVDAILEGN